MSSVQFVCLRRPAQASNHMFIMSEMLAWLPAFVDRKLGLTSRDFNGFHRFVFRNIQKMSVGTTSNDEMQPESERRVAPIPRLPTSERMRELPIASNCDFVAMSASS